MMEAAFDIKDVLQKNNMGKSLEEKLSKLTAIDSTLTNGKISETVMGIAKEIPFVQEFFDSPMGDKSEARMKKVVIAALIAGTQKGYIRLPFENVTAEGLAGWVDKSLTAAKTAYHVGTGKMTASDALEIMIDHAAVVATKIVTNAINRVEKFALDHVDTLVDKTAAVVSAFTQRIAQAYPQTRPVAVFIPVIIERAKPIVKTYIKEGIHKVAEISKPLARKAIQALAATTKKLANSVKRRLLIN